MKKVLGASIFIVLLFVLVLQAYSKEEKPPEAVFLRKIYDFGEIKEGAKVSTIFLFKNKGESDLIINDVRVSCGCTAVLLSSKTIKPGKTAELKVTFDSRGFKGEIKKSIYVHSNDPQHPIIQLRIESRVLS
jgi:hypothetical protein